MSTLELENIKHPDNSGDNIALASNGSITIDRKSTNGTIAEFRKDGTTVGSIGTFGNDVYMGQDDTGIRCGYAGINTLIPFDVNSVSTTDGSSDGVTDLGHSARRFKDLYLSGGVYLGGTGTANKLDDYEEGSWTPTNPTVTLTSVSGRYIKVGSVVHLHASVTVPSTSSSAHFVVDGFPFAQKDTDAAAGFYMRYTSDSVYRMFYLSNGNAISVYNLGGGTTPLSSVSTGRYDFSGVYYTDS
jgi:hypothetical protein